MLAGGGAMRSGAKSSPCPQGAPDAVLEYVDQRSRVNTDANDYGDEAGHAHLLPPGRCIRQMTPAFVRRTEEDALHRPEDVARGLQDAEHGDDRRRREALNAAEENEKLGDKPRHRG